MGVGGRFRVTTLVCLGFGYSAQHYVALYAERFDRIVGTTRSEDNAAMLRSRRLGDNAVETLVFDGVTASAALAAAIADADVLLVSIAPHQGADPALTHLHDAIVAAARLGSIVYLSTIAVYGNHDGRWIDETTPLTPALTRASDRVEAECAWRALGEAHGIPVTIVRIAGIYGPGSNALETLKAGRARRISKPGQVFNRIHVGDLAQIIDKAVDMALSRRIGGTFNAADDEPAAPGDPIVFAASLLRVAPPPEVAFDEVKKTMTAFALSFYGESKRVRNDRIKSVLGVSLRYPTYREGLRMLASEAGMFDQN
jgi:nucleoside-diphosphate-sugar epimerase